MKRLLRLLTIAAALPALPVSAQFYQIDQSAVLYSYRVVDPYERGMNYSSFRGVAGKAGTAIGVDGRISIQGTANQFRSVASYGAIVRPVTTDPLPTGKNFEQDAVLLNLPRGGDGPGQVSLVLRSSQVGASTYTRPVNFQFGAIITPPIADERGNNLVSPLAYWEAEPYTPTNHDGRGYYWSPHARSVFATQPGPVSVTWRKQNPDAGLGGTEGVNKLTINGLSYLLTNVNYVVSGAASKQPRKIFWTEKSFRATGHPVQVPNARVGAVYFHYSSAFPRTDTKEYAEIGDTSITEGSTNATLKELRTLWYDSQQGLIFAYNREGRCFMELLGDITGPNTRRHLGFEIVDVFKQPRANELVAELGDRIMPYADGNHDLDLSAAPLLDSVSTSFLYRQPIDAERSDYFAVKETVNPNDALVHWLEPGIEGLRWPYVFNRYTLIWPDDLRRYSHYVRPPAATEAEARQTAVPLPTDNAPAIQYQDPLDQPRAKLTEKTELYTWLDAAHPFHRTLIRYTSGDRVEFERVASSLTTALARPPASGGAVDTATSVLARHPGRTSVLNLDGKSGYGQLPDDYYFGSTGFTVEAWVYVRGVQLWQRLIDFGNGSTADNVLLALSAGANGMPLFQVFTGSTANTPLNVSEPLPLNAWTHIAVVQEPPAAGATTGLTRIYLNGVYKAQAQTQVPNRVMRTHNYVGKSNWGGDSLANIALDDLRIWSTSRTPGQIAEDMTSLGYPAGTPNLIGQFLFQEAGTVCPDSSGQGHHMTLVGTAVVASNPTLPATPGSGLAELSRAEVPRYIETTAQIGDRLVPPAGELGSGAGESYLAGYIYPGPSTSYHPTAYRNPFAAGFETARLSAIIPVNAIPGRDQLEVWWFRRSSTNAQRNEINGFKPVYWPSVIARYRLTWPTAGSEIVLASNAGSGALDSLQAKGSIYVQNDPRLPGYNPNEEHALMIGGQAYALRDDLNITSGSRFSSQPFVLLDYTAEDGRPAIRPFRVLREKPTDGIVFDYVVEAGSRLQAPMPLPLLPPPTRVETNTAGEKFLVNLNSEPLATAGDLPPNWNPTTHGRGFFANYARFTYKDRKENFWVMRGLHSGLPPLQAGKFTPRQGNTPEGWDTNLVADLIANTKFTNYIHTSRRSDSLVVTTVGGSLPSGVSFGSLPDGLALYGTAPAASSTNQLVITDGDGSRAIVNLALLIGNTRKTLGPIHITSTNAYAGANTFYVGRPPRLADPPTPTNCFTMRFYYKTQDGFAWPGIANPPPVGTIVPYLRPVNSDGSPAAETTPSLDIVYRPTWPGNPPKVAYGETITVPSAGRPAIRGQTSLKLVYQQSIAADIDRANPAAVLHDPTRQKSFALGTSDATLAKVPDGVRSEGYQGKTYFPLLPPHLAQRFFFDPNVGAKGSLIFQGEFKDEPLGEKYLLLNVLAGSDLQTVQNLCPKDDPEKSKWDAAVAGLSTTVETFSESTSVLGKFIPNPDLTVIRGVESLTVVTNDNTAVDSYALSASGPGTGYVTLVAGDGAAFTPPGEPVSMYILRVTGQLYTGEIKVLPSANPLNELITFQHTADLAGQFNDYEYQWKIAPPVDGFPPVANASMSRYQPLVLSTNIPRYTLGGSGIQVLSDNYLVMRYRPINPAHPLYSPAPPNTATNWSAWTRPVLAEGWIKRVLAGINPFGQRVTDLFNNTVNTDASVLVQAGHRFEGAVALNMDNINNYGLIEIYETVLKRGRLLSIDAGINYGPANDALLLAAGYLNDLYMLVGNEAFADAANPTIGIGTKDNQYGEIATALFSFKGQLPTLLQEELALLRGRDDVALPGVEIAPVYNRLVWNFTRGIDSGEVIYSLNYNILDQNNDGRVDAADAAKLYPQGHGDAYGHYLTALKGYYSLLMNPYFEWVPRIEAVNILGQPVTVDYLDERKFASAASALARTGRQIVDLVWREEYVPGQDAGWERFSTKRVSGRTIENGLTTTNIVRYWGLDHWASRTSQGAFLNWVVGNSILPDNDPDPTHEGIQKVDRTTVPELQELASIANDVQTSLDNAEARLTPLGLPEGSLAFDIDPTKVAQSEPQTHFEQLYARAKQALDNATAAFDDAKDVTRLMRSEQDSLFELQTSVAEQELAFTNALVEIYGTPYPEDVGVGKTYRQGYAGPDFIHYAYVDNVELNFGSVLDPTATESYKIDIQAFPENWLWGSKTATNDFSFINYEADRSTNQYVTIELAPHGYFQKPTGWTSRRASPGELQQAISDVIKARNDLNDALGSGDTAKKQLDGMIRVYKSGVQAAAQIHKLEEDLTIAEQVAANAERANEIFQIVQDSVELTISNTSRIAADTLPHSIIAGLATGGDFTSAARGLLENTGAVITEAMDAVAIARNSVVIALRAATDAAAAGVQLNEIYPLERTEERRQSLLDLAGALDELQGAPVAINRCLQQYDDARRHVAELIARGDRIQHEREVVRQRTAAIVQGFRTRDAAFRIFRNEKLERYKSLFDLAARYAYLAATAYDYETGLLNTDKGRQFINRIVSSRALGVMRDGEPQYAGSNTGDPGLSSALAEMKADWDVLRGRLGFNSPDVASTLVSYRTENLRIVPGADGLTAWQDYLQSRRMDNVLDDPDVRRYCLQAAQGQGLPVPGIVLTFSTTVTPGQNLFGRSLAAGDSSFHRSSFATKIRGVGVALPGYRGMNTPGHNSAAGNYAIGSGTNLVSGDPSMAYLDPDSLASTPYVYLIPVGTDSMRSPPLGDTSDIRSWQVNDVAVPMPFNIGGNGFSTHAYYQAADSLTEPLFSLRKHQAFRPVDSAEPFNEFTLEFSPYTNARLIGRSVWNSQWKLVIPGDALLNDPKEGLNRFIRTVTDVQLYFVTYSYAGN